MKTTKQTLLILFIIFLTVPVFAADTIDYIGYKELYENQKEYNSNIIATTITIFAISCGLVLTLQLVTWFTDQRKYKKFVQDIIRQQTSIVDGISKQIQDLKTKIDTNTTEIDILKSQHTNIENSITAIELSNVKEIQKQKAGIFELYGKTYELNNKFDLAIFYYCLAARVNIDYNILDYTSLHNINMALFNVNSLGSSTLEFINEILRNAEESQVKTNILKKLHDIEIIQEEVRCAENPVND